MRAEWNFIVGGNYDFIFANDPDGAIRTASEFPISILESSNLIEKAIRENKLTKIEVISRKGDKINLHFISADMRNKLKLPNEAKFATEKGTIILYNIKGLRKSNGDLLLVAYSSKNNCKQVDYREKYEGVVDGMNDDLIKMSSKLLKKAGHIFEFEIEMAPVQNAEKAKESLREHTRSHKPTSPTEKGKKVKSIIPR